MMATVLPLLFGTEGTDECFLTSCILFMDIESWLLHHFFMNIDFSGKLSIRSVTSVLLCIMST